jgi:ribosomal protein S18 acetylase RimI-like enzyme
MEVHVLGPAHADALARFFEVLKAHGIDKTFHPHPLTAEAALELTHYAGKDLYFVLRKGGDVMGYAMLRGWDEGYEVPSLGICLHPHARSQGLARLLMDFLHVAAQRRGAKKIRLRVCRDNKPAITLYRSLGYELTEDRDLRYLLGFLDLDCS